MFEQLVIFRVSADPKPHDRVSIKDACSSIVEVDANRIHVETCVDLFEAKTLDDSDCAGIGGMHLGLAV